jgi:hypothetical protein
MDDQRPGAWIFISHSNKDIAQVRELRRRDVA